MYLTVKLTHLNFRDCFISPIGFEFHSRSMVWYVEQVPDFLLTTCYAVLLIRICASNDRYFATPFFVFFLSTRLDEINRPTFPLEMKMRSTPYHSSYLRRFFFECRNVNKFPLFAILVFFIFCKTRFTGFCGIVSTLAHVLAAKFVYSPGNAYLYTLGWVC